MNNQPLEEMRAPARKVRPIYFAGVILLAVLTLAGVYFVRTLWFGTSGRAIVNQEDARLKGDVTGGSTSVHSTSPAQVSVLAGGKHPSPFSGQDQVLPGAMSVEQLIRILNDSARPLSERSDAAKALAKLGSPEAMSALKEVLAKGASELRAVIARALGECPALESVSLLAGLLSDKDEKVAMAAVGGIARKGTAESVNTLRQLLWDPSERINVRSEAALGLGGIDRPEAMDALLQAATLIKDEDIVNQVLNALGSRSIDETQAFFQNYIRSPTVGTDLKVTALESLSEAQGDVSPFLKEFVSDLDPELRAAAAWALSANDTRGTIGPQLLALLQNEKDAQVRKRLFEALANQDSFDAGGVLATVRKETDPTVRIAGMDLVASRLGEESSADELAYFEREAVPQLKDLALNAVSSQDRMAAIIALKRAGTPNATIALRELAQQAKDARVASSARLFFGSQD